MMVGMNGRADVFRSVANESDIALNEVVWPVPAPLNPVWDAALGNVRERNAAEFDYETRRQIKDKINTERTRREQLGFAYMGKVIDSDRDSIQRITVMTINAQIALANNVPFDVVWTCADNSQLPLDAAGVLGMMPALGGYGKAVYERCKALKAQVDASATPETIDILAGWPV